MYIYAYMDRYWFIYINFVYIDFVDVFGWIKAFFKMYI